MPLLKDGKAVTFNPGAARKDIRAGFPGRLRQIPGGSPAATLTASVQLTQAHRTSTTVPYVHSCPVHSGPLLWVIPGRGRRQGPVPHRARHPGRAGGLAPAANRSVPGFRGLLPAASSLPRIIGQSRAAFAPLLVSVLAELVTKSGDEVPLGGEFVFQGEDPQ